jgi:hypothetical protein
MQQPVNHVATPLLRFPLAQLAGCAAALQHLIVHEQGGLNDSKALAWSGGPSP